MRIARRLGAAVLLALAWLPLAAFDSAGGVLDSGEGSRPFPRAAPGAAARSLADKLGDLPFTPADLGAVCDGKTPADEAVATLTALSGEIVFPAGGVCRLTKSTTWPSGKVYRFAPGSGVSLDSGATLTIRGAVEAPLARVFSGAGKVTGLAHAKPEWWGATGDGGDDHPALQSAVDAIAASFGSDGGEPRLALRYGANYGLGRQLTLTPTAYVGLTVTGGGNVFGSRFTALAGFDPSGGPAAVWIKGSPGAIDQIASFDIGGFSIVRADGSKAQIGLLVGGDADSYLKGTLNNRIHHVYVEGFARGLQVQNARVITFESVATLARRMTDAIGLLVTVTQPKGFTGDLIFNGCQFETPNDFAAGDAAFRSNGRPAALRHAIRSGQIKGVRFPNTTFYYGTRMLEINVANGGAIGDIFVPPGAQFDGVAETAIHIGADGAGSVIDDIQITGIYARGLVRGGGVLTSAARGGVVRGVMVMGGWFASVSGGARAVLFGAGTSGSSANGITVQDFDGPDQEAILLNGDGNAAIGNTLARQPAAIGTARSFVTVGDGVSGSMVGLNNSGGIARMPVMNLGGPDNTIASNR